MKSFVLPFVTILISWMMITMSVEAPGPKYWAEKKLKKCDFLKDNPKFDVEEFYISNDHRGWDNEHRYILLRGKLNRPISPSAQVMFSQFFGLWRVLIRYWSFHELGVHQTFPDNQEIPGQADLFILNMKFGKENSYDYEFHAYEPDTGEDIYCVRLQFRLHEYDYIRNGDNYVAPVIISAATLPPNHNPFRGFAKLFLSPEARARADEADHKRWIKYQEAKARMPDPFQIWYGEKVEID